MSVPRDRTQALTTRDSGQEVEPASLREAPISGTNVAATLTTCVVRVGARFEVTFLSATDPEHPEFIEGVRTLHAANCPLPEGQTLASQYRAVARSGNTASFVLHVRAASGVRLSINCHLVPEFTSGDKSAVIGVFSDLTSTRFAAELADAQEQKLQAILKHMPGFCYTLDHDLVFRSSRGAGLGPMNLQQDQVVGMALTDMWGTIDASYEPLLCHRAALAGESATYRDVCAGRSLEYQIEPLRDQRGVIIGVIGVGFDVTDEERAKEEQLRLTAQLRQAQKMEAIGRLAGGVAHDFNNLLTCIMGNISFAEQFLEPDSKVARNLAEANAAADSAARLTHQLLAFGRKQVIDPRPVNLSHLIERMGAMLKRLIGESIVLKIQCSADLWSIQADPGQLEQVLVNLVVNARDAITGHGEIVVETTNQSLTQAAPDSPEGLEPGDYVVLTVWDTGRGMSDVVRSRLFEPFFTTKETGEGTGLGLAVVYGAVHQNGGTICVDSRLAEGSVFRIFLPRVDSALALVPEELFGARQPAGMPVGTETILLVEDEPTLLEVAHCTLHQLGYNVLPCLGADEALRTFATLGQRVDLLVTDVVMPRMNGSELASRISSLQPGIAVLYSSGYGEKLSATPGAQDSRVEFLGKPYRPGELATKVRAVLDQAQAELASQRE